MAFWGTYARVYDMLWDTPITWSTTDAAAALVNIPTDGVIVDLGCGTGLCAGVFQGRGRLVVGVDSSAVMLRRARRHRRIDVPVRADARSTGLAAGCADVVVLANILHLFPDPTRLLTEATRLARASPNTRLVYITPSPTISPARLADAERNAGRSLSSVIITQLLRAHIALLADMSGAARRPDWQNVHRSLMTLEASGWACVHATVVSGCQEIRVYAHAEHAVTDKKGRQRETFDY